MYKVVGLLLCLLKELLTFEWNDGLLVVPLFVNTRWREQGGNRYSKGQVQKQDGALFGCKSSSINSNGLFCPLKHGTGRNTIFFFLSN